MSFCKQQHRKYTVTFTSFQFHLNIFTYKIAESTKKIQYVFNPSGNRFTEDKRITEWNPSQ